MLEVCDNYDIDYHNFYRLVKRTKTSQKVDFSKRYLFRNNLF